MSYRAFIRLTTILLFASSSLCLYGQGYQRLFYDADRIIFNNSSAPLNSGGFYTVNIFFDQVGSGISVIQHDAKGDLIWDRDYLIDDAVYNFPIQTVECQNVGGDTLLVMGSNLESFQAENERFLMLIEPMNGSVIWSTTFLDSENEIDAGISSIARAFKDEDGFYNYFGTHNSDATIGVHYERFDDANNAVFSQTYSGILDTFALGLNLADATLTRDKGIAAAAGAALNLGAVIKWDSMSNVDYSTIYASPAFPVNQFVINSINPTRDTGMISTATVVDLASGVPFAAVYKTDSIGAVVWSKAFTLLAESTIAVALDAIETRQGEHMVVGKAINTDTGVAFEWGVFLDEDGNSLRQYSYGGPSSFWQVQLNQNIFRPEAMDLMEFPSGEMLLTTSGLEANQGLLAPMIIRTDAIGQANCQDTIDVADAIIDFPIIWDTLDLTTNNIASMDTLEVTSREYDMYDVPVVRMQDTFYCPQDPIMKLLDATTPEAVSYLWSTGDTTETIIAMEEGDYAVTVTIDENICYTLCDTVNVAQGDFPTASIDPDNRFCCDKQFILGAGSSTDIAGGVMWSNMETTVQITVDAVPGTVYSVTITDSCDNTATASFSIPDNPENVANIVVDETNICTAGTVDLIATSTSPCDNNKTYLWGDMEDTPRITVDGPDTYTVTVTDDCGDEAIAQVVLDPMLFELPDPEVVVDKLGISSFTCNLRLTATPSSGTPGYTYLWEDGATIDNIEVSTADTYSVTVTDRCMKEVIGSIVVTDADLEIPPPTVTVSAGPVSRATCGIILTSVGTAIAPGFEITSTTWNTNESEMSISVTEPGTYEVVVTDNCGTASAQIVLTAADFELGPPTGSISSQIIENCVTRLTAVTNEDASLFDYSWSNGSNEQFIESQEGTFTVVVSDRCGNSAEFTETITPDMNPPQMSRDPDITDGVDSCTFNVVVFYEDESEPLSFNWSNGESSSTITVETGIYMVTVTDPCGNTSEAEIAVGSEDAVQYPNIFFPLNPIHPENESFGPKLNCGEDLQDYNFEIFNRWGKRVFESEAVDDRWTGRLNNQGTLLEEDVYMWQASWIDEVGEQTRKGHVTLVRSNN